MKGSNEGIKNEKDIIATLNMHHINNLPTLQQNFIKFLNDDIKHSDVILAKGIGGQGLKPDIEIKINNKIYNISIKKGSGNSIHQEKTDYFIQYCKTFLGMTDLEKNSLLLYLYGDGTIDGDSEKEDRLDGNELIETYKEEIAIVQKFLDKNKRILVERFIKYGRLGKQKNIYADYLYYGDTNDGVWCDLNTYAIDYLVGKQKNDTSSLSIGPFNLQVWNRNPNANTNMEDRRHSIQVKWTTCKNDISEIKQYCEKQINEQKKRKIGDNSVGFLNQENIALLINNQRIEKLNENLKELITSLFPRAAFSEFVISGKVRDNKYKPSVFIEISGDKKYISISKGTGNSVHQENIKYFIPYCLNELDMTEIERVSFMKILYGDGTIDGSGEANNRLSDDQIKDKMGIDIDNVQKFLDRNRKYLIERFIKYGRFGKTSGIKVDAIYYGTTLTGRSVGIDNVVKYLCESKNREDALLSIGNLTIQTWNRNLSFNPKFEYKRDSIQIKWSSMKNDIVNVRSIESLNTYGTCDGNWEEFELVANLNRNKNNSNNNWKLLAGELNIADISQYYAVKISSTVYSKLSDRNVLPKSDIYLVCGNISKEVLVDNNYWLDEDVIRNFDINLVKGSGISCKRPTSKSFTYCKLTVNSFNKIFKNKFLGAGISLFISKNDLENNKGIIEAWGCKEREFIEYFIDLGVISKKDLLCEEICKKIKSYSISETTRLIKENINISSALFWGVSIFMEPYNASFVYELGNLKKIYMPNFTITTGSGRHKGKITVIIKP